MENEILIAENVEIDMETLYKALSVSSHYLVRGRATVSIVEAVIKALSPEARNKLEEYRNK